MSPLGGITGQQRGLGLLGLQMHRDGTGIGDQLLAIAQHRHLALAGELEQLDLPHARGHIFHAVAESFCRQQQVHFFAKGRVAELKKLHGRRAKQRLPAE